MPKRKTEIKLWGRPVHIDNNLPPGTIQIRPSGNVEKSKRVFRIELEAGSLEVEKLPDGWMEIGIENGTYGLAFAFGPEGVKALKDWIKE